MFRNYLVVSGSVKARETLATTLRSRGCTVTLASNGAEAAMIVKNVSVDSVLIDAALPDTRGEALKKQSETIRPECRVLLITSFASVKGTRELLRFGDDDFLLHKGDLLDLLKSGHADEE